MKVTGVRVEVTKTLSDGNYGSERFVAQYIAELEEGEDPDAAVRELAGRGRAEVAGQLAQSESSRIRWAIEPPKRTEALPSSAWVGDEELAEYEGGGASPPPHDSEVVVE